MTLPRSEAHQDVTLQRSTMMKRKAIGVVHLSKMTGRKVVPTEGGDQTKEKILTAAEKLFAKNGFDGVSMRDVGRAAEVPFALITYHFQTKLGLYQALFRRRQDLLTTQRLERDRKSVV